MKQDHMDVIDVDDGVEYLVNLTARSEQPQTQGATVQIVLNGGSGDSFIAVKDGEMTRRIVFHRNTLIQIANSITAHANGSATPPVA